MKIRDIADELERSLIERPNQTPRKVRQGTEIEVCPTIPE